MIDALNDAMRPLPGWIMFPVAATFVYGLLDWLVRA